MAIIDANIVDNWAINDNDIALAEAAMKRYIEHDNESFFRERGIAEAGVIWKKLSDECPQPPHSSANNLEATRKLIVRLASGFITWGDINTWAGISCRGCRYAEVVAAITHWAEFPLTQTQGE